MPRTTCQEPPYKDAPYKEAPYKDAQTGPPDVPTDTDTLPGSCIHHGAEDEQLNTAGQRADDKEGGG